MKTLSITLYPYAVQYGELSVPDDLTEDEYQSYVNDHFDEIELGVPDLVDYGTDMDIYDA